jgi:hypothetical protein
VRAAAYVAGGLGVVALGVGVVSGVRALHASSGADGHCDGDVCDAVGASARRDEVSAANVATGGFVAGGALLATAAALRVLSPSESERPYVTRNLGYVAGATGLVAIGAGVTLAIRAAAEKADANPGCNGDVCDHGGAAARRAAIAAANAATVALTAGGVLVAGGVALWIGGRRASAPAVGSLALAPTPGGAALGWEGAW